MKASCQSLTSQFLKVIGDFTDDYQELRKTAAKTFLNVILPNKAGSEKELEKLVEQAMDLQTKLLKSYGVMVGEGKGKIGPRHQIIPTKKVTGDLLTERTYLCPPSIFSKVTVIIKKTGGKAGADIAVCAKYPNGSIFNEKRKSLDKGKDEKGDVAKFILTDMADKALTIHLVKTGFPTNTCDYSLSIEGEFEKEEMEKLVKKTAGSAAVRA